MITSSVKRSRTLAVERRVAGFRHGGGGIPRTGLLFYASGPNSDEYLIGEDTEIGEDTYIWGFYTGTAPAIVSAIEAALGAGNVLEGVALATEIASAAGVNENNVLFKLTNATMQTGKLAVYSTDTDLSILVKAYRALRIPIPSVYLVDTDGNILTSGADALIIGV